MICDLIRWGIRLGRESEAGRRSKEMVFGGLGGLGVTENSGDAGAACLPPVNWAKIIIAPAPPGTGFGNSHDEDPGADFQ